MNSSQPQDMDWEYNFEYLSNNIESKPKRVYIVFDTNVLINSFGKCLLSSLTTFNAINIDFEIYFVLPWMVIQELDLIKDNRSRKHTLCVQKSAQDVVRNIYKIFRNQSSNTSTNKINFIGQKVSFPDYECPDDHIMETCLQMKNKNANVLFLTDDMCLSIKALTHNIAVLSSNDMVKLCNFRERIDPPMLTQLCKILYDKSLHKNGDIKAKNASKTTANSPFQILDDMSKKPKERKPAKRKQLKEVYYSSLYKRPKTSSETTSFYNCPLDNLYKTTINPILENIRAKLPSKSHVSKSLPKLNKSTRHMSSRPSNKLVHNS